MINADMRKYDFLSFGDKDEYGQPTISKEIQGNLKIAIYTLSQTTEDSILYKDATYVGLTQDYVNDKFVILNGSEKLKVLYIQPKGRYKQVFMKVIN